MQLSREIETTQATLALARRRAEDLQPYSPAWDAAMSWVEDLEREAVSAATTPSDTDEDQPAATGPEARPTFSR